MERSNIKVRMHKACCAKVVQNVRFALIYEKETDELVCGKKRVYDRLETYTGLGKGTLKKLIKEENLLDETELETRDRGHTMSLEDEALIRPIIVQMVIDKITPTVLNINNKLTDMHEGWTWSRSSLYNALQRMEFHFNTKRQNYYDRLREEPRNVALRILYLQNHVQYVAEERPIVYMDESWINKNCRPSKSWHDGTIETAEKTPPGKGPRWILIGAGSKDGWIPNSFRMWKGTVKSEDYHSEMNGDVFYDWVHRYLLPNMPANGVLVIDRATYHLALTEDSKMATQTAKKEVLVEWLLAHHCKDEDGNEFTALQLAPMKKAALWALCTINKPAKKYLIHQWLQAWNDEHGTDIRLNTLPVAHPQLNPIEMVWSWIKTHVATNNHDYSMPGIRTLTEARVAQIGAEWWAKSCNKSEEFGAKCIAADDIAMEAGVEVDDADMVENEGSDSDDED